MIGSMDISMSGLIAQRARLNAISSNIANMSAMRNENGDIKPYQARHVIFETDSSVRSQYGAEGVKVAAVKIEDVEPLYKLQPDHPLAIKSGKHKGYVAYPKVDTMKEFVNAMDATRAYEANVGVIEATKNMGQQTLRIIA
jgi:flagellar basal-body rod protein FlgC